MSRFFTLLAMVLALSACGGKGDPGSGEKQGEPFLRCAEPMSDGTVEEFRLKPLTVERKGYDVTVRGLNRGLVVLGVLAGIAELSDATAKNIDLFLEHFKDAGAQAILVNGGVGRLPKDVHGILSRLAKAPIPILVTPGEQENLDVFRKTIASVRKTSPQILDMTAVRRVKIGNLSIVSLPGYTKPFYLKAGKRGCSFDDDDIDATVELFEKGRTSILLSPAPPRGQGEKAVDRGRNGVNMGDSHLTKALKASNVKFGIFGYAYESGGHATLADGRTTVAHGIWQESLFVQAGAAQATPITTVGEGRAAGMAQIVEFSGGRARYRTIYAVR